MPHYDERPDAQGNMKPGSMAEPKVGSEGIILSGTGSKKNTFPRPSIGARNTRARLSPAERNQYDIGYAQGKKEGNAYGQEKIRKIVLDWLENQYMRSDIKRGTPKAEAILEVTRGLSLVLKDHIVK